MAPPTTQKQPFTFSGSKGEQGLTFACKTLSWLPSYSSLKLEGSKFPSFYLGRLESCRLHGGSPGALQALRATATCSPVLPEPTSCPRLNLTSSFRPFFFTSLHRNGPATLGPSKEVRSRRFRPERPQGPRQNASHEVSLVRTCYAWSLSSHALYRQLSAADAHFPAVLVVAHWHRRGQGGKYLNSNLAAARCPRVVRAWFGELAMYEYL